MQRLRLVGAVSAAALGLAIACGGKQFSAGAGDAGGSGGSGTAGSNAGGTSAGRGGSAGSAGGASSGGSVGSGGTVGVAGSEPGTGAGPSTGGGGTGGSGAGGGGTTDGGVACTPASITFRMMPSPNTPEGYFCADTCAAWASVYSEDTGEWLVLSNNCGSIECESCGAPPCTDIACLSYPVSHDGVEMTWDGTHYTGDMCINPASVDMYCVKPTCLPHGTYVARMCAGINALASADQCQPGGDLRCVEMRFEYTGGNLVIAGELEP